MQKLSERNTYTPPSISLARCNCDSVLNRDESLSVQSLKTSDNSSEGNLRQHRGGSDSRVLNVVYVRNERGFPLMPTVQSKARRLLRCGKAKVVRRKPFTIQLISATGELKQKIKLGTDSGTGYIGFSCITEKKEIYSEQLQVETKMSDRLTDRKKYRRNKRNQLWHRKPRFLNRGNKKEGWLAPSVKRLRNLHEDHIKFLKTLMPITEVVTEIGRFDTSKLSFNDSELEEFDYQKGPKIGYENTKAYLISREHGSCQYCGKEKGNQPWHIHHIIMKSKSGSDRLANLALVHKGCHEKIHKSEKKLECKKPKKIKDATLMNILASQLRKRHPDWNFVFGYETYIKRIELGFPKDHETDAFIIAGGSDQLRKGTYYTKQKRRHNRSLEKLSRSRVGEKYRRCIRKNRYINQPGDLIKYNEKIYSVIGTNNGGKGIALKNEPKVLYAQIKNIKEIYHFGGLIW